MGGTRALACARVFEETMWLLAGFERSAGNSEQHGVPLPPRLGACQPGRPRGPEAGAGAASAVSLSSSRGAVPAAGRLRRRAARLPRRAVRAAREHQLQPHPGASSALALLLSCLPVHKRVAPRCSAAWQGAGAAPPPRTAPAQRLPRRLAGAPRLARQRHVRQAHLGVARLRGRQRLHPLRGGACARRQRGCVRRRPPRGPAPPHSPRQAW